MNTLSSGCVPGTRGHHAYDLCFNSYVLWITLLYPHVSSPFCVLALRIATYKLLTCRPFSLIPLRKNMTPHQSSEVDLCFFFFIKLTNKGWVTFLASTAQTSSKCPDPAHILILIMILIPEQLLHELFNLIKSTKVTPKSLLNVVG